MRFHHIPRFFQSFFKEFQWEMPDKEKKIYLTFDDGPIPEVTEFVLEQLAIYQAKATFFCVGDNIKKNPAVFEKIIMQEHRIGNHTFNHLNGWNTPNELYLENVDLCSQVMRKFSLPPEEKSLFRPPYGKIKSGQFKQLKDQYKVIMWSVLSYDFDKTISKEKCLVNSIKYTDNGSIVVFHDSVKTVERLYYALPLYLRFFTEQGYQFEKL